MQELVRQKMPGEKIAEAEAETTTKLRSASDLMLEKSFDVSFERTMESSFVTSPRSSSQMSLSVFEFLNGQAKANQ